MAENSMQVEACIREGHIRKEGEDLRLAEPRSRNEQRQLTNAAFAADAKRGLSLEQAETNRKEILKNDGKRRDFCELALRGPVMDRVADGAVTKAWIEKFTKSGEIDQIAMLHKYIGEHEILQGCKSAPSSWNAELSVSARTSSDKTVSTKVSVTCGHQALNLLIVNDPTSNYYKLFSHNSNQK